MCLCVFESVSGGRERENEVILQRTAELAKIVANSFFKPFFQEVQMGSFEALI